MKVLTITLLLLMVFSLTTAICYGQTAEEYFDKGIAYLNRGMFDEAVAEFKKALEINPNFAEAHTALGAAYANKGMPDKAIAEYRKAIEINPNHAGAHYNLGLVYDRKGMLNEAIAQYEMALEINPNLAEARGDLGRAYGEKGMLDMAIAECKKAIEINPNYAEAHHNLAVSYYYKREYSLAIKYYDKASELGYEVDPKLLEDLKPYRKNGQTARDYYERGIEYGVAREFEEAQQQFKKALEADPFYAPARSCLKIAEDVLKHRIKTETALHLFKGATYVNKGMLDEVMTEFKKAIRINPNYVEMVN